MADQEKQVPTSSSATNKPKLSLVNKKKEFVPKSKLQPQSQPQTQSQPRPQPQVQIQSYLKPIIQPNGKLIPPPPIKIPSVKLVINKTFDNPIEAEKTALSIYQNAIPQVNLYIIDITHWIIYFNTVVEYNIPLNDSDYVMGEVIHAKIAIYNDWLKIHELNEVTDGLEIEDQYDCLNFHKLLMQVRILTNKNTHFYNLEWLRSVLAELWVEYTDLETEKARIEKNLKNDDGGFHSIDKQKKKTKKKNILQNMNLNNINTITKPIVFKSEEEIDVNKLKSEAFSQELKVFDDSKEPLVSMFIGHVDSGKSTICGNILYLSGKVNEMEMEKYKVEAKENDRESWFLAYFMDINQEEKERGKTVEMGRASFDTKKKRFTILDCPGHRNYVQNMISGAAQADVANLVISAKPGEFEAGFEKDGQTREHAMLAKSLGAQFLVVIINKMDTVNWSEDRFNYIKFSLEPFLSVNCGYEHDRIFWVCISGLTNSNMKDPVEPSVMPWYKGLTLWETYDRLPSIRHSNTKILRIPILDKFKDKGIINSCTKIVSGIVRPNMTCIILPTQKEITITKVMDIDDNEMAYAQSGESVNLMFKGIEEDDLRRGFVICGQQFWIHVCQEFEAEVTTYELTANLFFGKGFVSIIHLHTILEEVEVTSVWKVERNDDGSERKIPVPGLKSGERGYARFMATKPICVEKYSEFEEMGRFALRKGTITLVSGRVTKIKPLNKETLKSNAFFVKDTQPLSSLPEKTTC